MAKRTAVRISPVEPHRANTSESEGIQTFTNSDCTISAGEVVDSGDMNGEIFHPAPHKIALDEFKHHRVTT